MIDDIKAHEFDIEVRQLLWVLFACAWLSLAQSILSLWHITSGVVEVWRAITVGVSAFWILGLVAVFLSSCIFAKSSKEVALIASLGLVVCLAAFFAYGAETALVARLFNSAKWLGLVGFLALAYQLSRVGGFKNLLVAACFTLFVPISSGYLPATYVAHPLTLDLYAYSFDLSLGWMVAPYFYNLAQHSWVVSTLVDLAYISVLGAYQILAALQTRFFDATVVPALRVFLIAAILGFGIYFIFPVVGPTPFFGASYPGNVPGLSDLIPVPTLAAFAPRNGVPSLHFAWSLLLLMNVPRRLKYGKAFYALFCYLTFIATMSTGEHYFVDLIAALPFVAAVQAIGLWISNARHSKYAVSLARSTFAFAAFVALIAVRPWWLQKPLCAWSVTAVVFIHFLAEIRSLRASSRMLQAPCNKLSVS